ncbi:hypothetical protein Golob_011588 [Gossypium lobatum]|uniref:Uncharacterized protein n=1 Tax=Gossypium lobatum TaxID=34289 RepID=A0A7J8MQ28_9ROSI|nr:hypothetical protein [Gossypium lobatum]
MNRSQGNRKKRSPNTPPSVTPKLQPRILSWVKSRSSNAAKILNNLSRISMCKGKR